MFSSVVIVFLDCRAVNRGIEFNQVEDLVEHIIRINARYLTNTIFTSIHQEKKTAAFFFYPSMSAFEFSVINISVIA